MKKLKAKPLVLCLAISLILFVIFFPSFYTSTDEKEYIENAYLITHNSLVRNDIACFKGAYCGYYNEEGWVSKYNLGWSFILLPFVNINWNLAFVVNFFFFILGIYIFKKLLDHYNLNKSLLFLYAFFPAFVYYSYKPLTETVTNTLVLLLYYLLYTYKPRQKQESPSKLIARSELISIVCGSLVLIRYTNAIVVVILLGGWSVRQILAFLKQRDKVSLRSYRAFNMFLLILFSCLPFLVVFLLINKNLYGGFLNSGYTLSGEEGLFDMSIFLKQLIYYSVILSTIYPLMLFSVLKSKVAGKAEILILILVFLIFYAGFPGYHFESGILDFIFGVRFFLPITGLLLLSYADVLNKLYLWFVTKRPSFMLLVNLSTFLLISTLIINATLIAYIYSKRTDELRSKSDEIYSKYEKGDIVETEETQDRILTNEAFKQGKVWVENPEWEKYK